MSRKLVFCVVSVVLASLVVAVPAGATVIDNFSTLSPAWVLSNATANSGANITYNITTNPGELTLNATVVSGDVQPLLMRSDYSMSVGSTLMTDLFPSLSTGNYGICIRTATGLTGYNNMLSVWVTSTGTELYDWNNAGTSVWHLTAAVTPSTLTQLYIAQTAASTFDVGYYVGATQHDMGSYTITGVGNLIPGAAIGYFTSTSFGASKVSVFDNFQLITPSPEPSTLALLAAGLVGLLCYAWRKRR